MPGWILRLAGHSGVFLVAVAVSIGLMILFRWNFFRWLGWVLAPVSIAYSWSPGLWGLNYYNRPIQESMKLKNRGLHCGGPAGCHASFTGSRPISWPAK